MDNIEFQNEKFKVREIELPKLGNVLISTSSLNQVLLNDEGNYISNEAISIDESIYYFVDQEEIEFSDEKLLNLLSIEVR